MGVCLQLSSRAVARVSLSLSLHMYQYIILFMLSFQPSLPFFKLGLVQ